MTASMIVLLAVALLLALIAVRVPVGFALGGAGAIGLMLLSGFDIATTTLGAVAYSSVARYAYVLVPLFILMGVAATKSDMARDVFAFAQRATRRVPGGLGVASVLSCAGFAAVSGSSVATVASLGKMSAEAMMDHGYDRKIAAGIVGSAGTLAVLIPPSIILVIYGVLSGERVGALLLAGILPGLFSAVAYMVAIVVWARITDRKAQELSIEGGSEPVVNAPTRGQQYTGLLAMAVLFIVVIGGIYSGFFTATEAGAVAAGVAVLFLLTRSAYRRTRPLTTLVEATSEAAGTTASLMIIVAGASVFTFFFLRAGVPTAFSRWVLDLGLSPTMVVIALLLACVPLGMFLEPVSMLMIVTPLAHPVVTQMGFDGVWFGILMVKMVELGLITPPVGMNAYVLTASIPGIELVDAFRGLMRFAAIDLIVIATLFLVPGIVTILPNALG